jgi:hypothetical protein
MVLAQKKLLRHGQVPRNSVEQEDGLKMDNFSNHEGCSRKKQSSQRNGRESRLAICVEVLLCFDNKSEQPIKEEER